MVVARPVPVGPADIVEFPTGYGGEVASVGLLRDESDPDKIALLPTVTVIVTTRVAFEGRGNKVLTLLLRTPVPEGDANVELDGLGNGGILVEDINVRIAVEYHAVVELNGVENGGTLL